MNRSELLKAIASTICDYRKGEINITNPDHVERWINQFKSSAQNDLLKELHYVLSKTYYSQDRIRRFLSALISSEKITGKDYCDFWKSSNILNIQEKGNSQKELLAIFDSLLSERCNNNVLGCGSGTETFFYIDDAIFTGGRIGSDLESWMNKYNKKTIILNIVVVALHSFAEHKVRERIYILAKKLGVSITVTFWHAIKFENRQSHKDASEVLWPSCLPDDDSELSAYATTNNKFPFEKRAVCEKSISGIYSSEKGRQLLEEQFLLAGMKIRSFSKNPVDILRPLGFSPFGLGFGSMFVTYRNCPNNCPLALWWGDPNEDKSHPLGKWYPLFQRKTYPKALDLNGSFSKSPAAIHF